MMDGRSFELKDELRQHQLRKIIFLVASLVVLIFFLLWGISVGSSVLSMRDVINTLLGKGDKVSEQIVYFIRMPRVLAAVATGAALSLSGAVIQTVIRNPLGSPFTLGLSAASAFGAAFAIVTLGALGGGVAPQFGELSQMPWVVTLSAFLFGLFCALLITGFARWRGATPEILVMAGIILTSLFQSGTSLLQYLSTDVELASVISWMFGDLAKATWNKVVIQVLVIFPSTVFFVFNAFNFNALNAGDEVARSLGVNVDRLRLLAVVVASLCAAVATAFFGIIAFVGLVVPHVTRWLVGYNDRIVLISSVILGGIFLLLADIISRSIIAPVVIPVGIVTSFVGAPFFLFLLAALIILSKEYKEVIWPSLLGIILLIIGIAGTLECFSPKAKKGGWLGFLSVWPLEKIFGFLVTQIIFWAAILAGIVIFWKLLSQALKEAGVIVEIEEKEEEEKESFIKKFFEDKEPD
ncbi:MAG: FecCD family ABC transporter permease, partial [Bacteroidota bacterium]